MERLAEASGVEADPGRTVVIGDTPLDIRCGRAIGAKVLAVATGGATLDDLHPHQADWLVEDLEAISATELCA